MQGGQDAGLDVLAFDVFGTVVDWYGSIVKEVAQCLPGVDPVAFTLAWRDGYQPAMQLVRSGTLGWTLIDDLHRMILDRLLEDFDAGPMTPAQLDHLNRVWHRLDPWPDVVPGLARLKSRFILCTLSNGNLGLLTRLARHGGLPWDCLLSAEVFRRYKPDPETYLGAARTMGVAPARVLMVAAHQDDLDAARACGLRTAYIERPLEFGPTRPKDVRNMGRNDWHARSFTDLADQLGC